MQWADVLVIPGGFGSRELVAHERLLEWIRRVHATAQWTAAVSTGSVLLAAAGVLAGRDATTHWLAADLLAQFGATPVPKRVVRSGTIITAVGAAAAIDMALWLAARAGGRQRADAIRAELAMGLDDAFDPDSSHTAAAIVRGWRNAAPEPHPHRPTALRDRLRRRSPRRVIRRLPPTDLATPNEDVLELDNAIWEFHDDRGCR